MKRKGLKQGTEGVTAGVQESNTRYPEERCERRPHKDMSTSSVHTLLHELKRQEKRNVSSLWKKLRFGEIFIKRGHSGQTVRQEQKRYHRYNKSRHSTRLKRECGKTNGPCRQWCLFVCLLWVGEGKAEKVLTLGDMGCECGKTSYKLLHKGRMWHKHAIVIRLFKTSTE